MVGSKKRALAISVAHSCWAVRLLFQAKPRSRYREPIQGQPPRHHGLSFVMFFLTTVLPDLLLGEVICLCRLERNTVGFNCSFLHNLRSRFSTSPITVMDGGVSGVRP